MVKKHFGYFGSMHFSVYIFDEGKVRLKWVFRGRAIRVQTVGHTFFAGMRKINGKRRSLPMSHKFV